MRRDIFKFFSGFAAAASVGHVAAAVATRRGMISVPLWRGREWGVGKIMTEAVVYGAIGAVLAYLGWRAEPPAASPPDPGGPVAHHPVESPAAVAAQP